MESTVVGQYRVLKKLGEGGMGAVYVGEHALIGRKAAIKVLLPQLSANQEIVQRFFNEARAATAVADPGIVQIFDFGYHTDGSAFIVMEFLEGETLDGRLRRLGRLAPHDVARILRQAATTLAAAHARGIIHRDLKPENIFLVRDNEVAGGERPKILDFGIAKLTGDDASKVKTHTAAIMGTPWFMSPEQCRGAGQVDHRSDIYAMGCVMFHLLTGTPPFDGEGAGDIIASHLREPAPAPSSRVPGIAPEVDQVVLACLAKSPDQRYQTMTDLAGALAQLERFVTSPGSLQVAPPSAPHAAYGTAPPTTLSSVASQVGLAAPTVAPPAQGKKRGMGLAIGAVMLAAAGAVAAVIVTQSGGGGGGGSTQPTTTEPTKSTPPAAKPKVEEAKPKVEEAKPKVEEAKPEAPKPEPATTEAEAKAKALADLKAATEAKAKAAAEEEQRKREERRKKRQERRKKRAGKCTVPGDTDCDGIPDDRY